MSDFTPLSVTLHIDPGSPVVMTGPIHLDGLLASQMVWCCGNRSTNLGVCGEEPSECIHLPLARMYYRGDSWYRASALIPSGISSIAHWNKRWDAENEDYLDVTKSGKVERTNGHYREYHVPMQIISMDSARFFCYGHRDKIRALLKRLGAIGKKTSSGYGRIARIEVSSMDGDEDTFTLDWKTTDGKPARNLPVEFCKEQNLIHPTTFRAPIEPPYWRVRESNTRECALWW